MQQYPRIAMSEIKTLYRPGRGRHWFDPETMVFFRTVLPGAGLRTPFGNFFVTGETPPGGKRRFSIRVQDETGDIDTIGKFNSFHTPGPPSRSFGNALKRWKARMRDMTTGIISNKYRVQTRTERAKFSEPLYNLDEIAEKLKMPAGKMRIDLGVNRSEGAPEPARKSTTSGKHLYRLSDFKKYFKRQEATQ